MQKRRDPSQPQRRPRIRLLACAIALAATGCYEDGPRPRTPEQTRAQLLRLLPVTLDDRAGWAGDIQVALTSMELDASNANLCAVLAVTEQESTYVANPAVPGLGRIARTEIEDRAAGKGVPRFMVRAAMQIEAPNGQTWDARIGAVRTEKELSDIFEELTDRVPMGRRLFANANPVRTGGPMQVSIAFAEAHARDRTYPHGVVGSIRHEVFTRHGGMYFGIAHLLDYPASYTKPLFRFADFNAGRYASRNAAFQNAVAVATGIPLDLDGDLIRHGKDASASNPSATEAAVRTMATSMQMSVDEIARDLRQSHRNGFEESRLYRQVYALGDQRNGRALPRATLPRIRLESPKITRKLTTEWFATRVDRRWRNCMARAERG